MSTAQLPDAGISQQEKHAPISLQSFQIQAEMPQLCMSLQKKLTALLMRIKRYFALDKEFNYNKKEK